MVDFLLLLLLLATVAGSSRQESHMWFWGCYTGGNCTPVPSQIWQLINSSRPIATGIFAAFGHNLVQGGQKFGIPKDGLPELMHMCRAANISVSPIVEYWDKTSDSYKHFIRNDTAQQNFIDAFVADAVAQGYAGYNFDWEFGDFNATDTALMAKFVQKFAVALAPHGKSVSTCAGDMRYHNCDLVQQPNYVAYDMSTYTASITKFTYALWLGLHGAGRNKSDAAHYGVGLSYSSNMWKQPPTNAQLRARFCALKLAGISRISMFGGSMQALQAYTPFLRDFVQGESRCFAADMEQ